MIFSIIHYAEIVCPTWGMAQKREKQFLQCRRLVYSPFIHKIYTYTWVYEWISGCCCVENSWVARIDWAVKKQWDSGFSESFSCWYFVSEKKQVILVLAY